MRHVALLLPAVLLLITLPVPAAPGADLAALVETLENGPSLVARRAAVRALAEMGPEAAPAVEPLRKALIAGDPILAALAADALGQIGRAARPAMEDLIRLAAVGFYDRPKLDHEARLSLETLTAHAWRRSVTRRTGSGWATWHAFEEEGEGLFRTIIQVTTGSPGTQLQTYASEEVSLDGPYLWTGDEVLTLGLVDGYLIQGAVIRDGPRVIACCGLTDSGRPEHWRFKLDRAIAPGVKGTYRGFRTPESPQRGPDGIPRFGPSRAWSGKFTVVEKNGLVVTLGPHVDEKGVHWNFWGGCFRWHPELGVGIREGSGFYDENVFPAAIERLATDVAKSALGPVFAGDDAGPFLARQLAHPEPAVKTYVLRWLQALEDPGGAETARILLEHWSDYAPQEHRVATATLVRVGAAAVPAILKALPTADNPKRHALLYALGEMGGEAATAAEALGRLVVEEDEHARFARRALEGIGPAATGAVPLLEEYVVTAHGMECVEAIKTLRKIDPESPAIPPAIRREIRHRNRWVRKSAVDTLGKTPPELTAEIAAAVLHVLKSRFAGNRSAALMALPKMEGLPPEALPAIAALLDDKVDHVRMTAANSLAALDPDHERLGPVAIALLESERDSTASDAAQLLEKLGERAIPAIPALTEALRHDHWWVRRASARALGGLGPKARSAIPALTRLLQDPERVVQNQAKQALRSIKGD